ncbi:hypothetical protein HU200_067071 [Digitaria exilis]|uniref:4a-hydroxytetrahydrobiopterin dehydratase n=1 Tax=Digitaria exilis TaxID=1010633 RepID=A0A835DT78_9POAL|nr:hypothetical protein HU200_067071 [Digitaria exilis]CAB3479025.1 unnamed protein product [Digitaria exilis]
MALSLPLPLASPLTAAAASTFTPSFQLHPSAVSMRHGRVRAPPRGNVTAKADLLGDLGGRDPFPEEIESKFGEKVLGNVDTLHNILIPSLSALSLAGLPLQPAAAAEPLSLDDARRLLLKVVGWRLVLSDDERRPARLQCVWKVRDEACGQELVARINAALDGAEHGPAVLAMEAPNNQVRAELSTPSDDGDCLTVNDFIVAARIDKVKTLDLIPKKRVWA